MNNTAGDPGSAKPSILVVDDFAYMRAWLTYVIKERFPYCRVIEAESGEDALDTVSKQSTDIVVMDIGLPGINGIETAKRIKSVIPEVKIVIFTIYDDAEYRFAAEEAGASAYLIKHKMGEELITVIKNILGGSDKEADNLSSPPVI